MKKKYKNIFFDLDNTLWDFNKNSYAALKITLTQYNLISRIPNYNLFYEAYDRINELLWVLYREKQISKQELIIQRFSRTFSEFSINGIDSVEFNGLYLSFMAEQKILFDNALEILEYLRKKQYKLYIITNGFAEVQLKKLKNSGISSYFSKVIVSEEIKSPKPNREIFEHALKTTNSRKKESLFIGDSWIVDIKGAMSFGMDQIYFKPDGDQKFSDSEILDINNSKTNTLRIKKLIELKEIL